MFMVFDPVLPRERREPGLVVPMPRLPLSLFTNSRGELVPTANKAFWVGVEEATYKLPANVEVAVVEVE